MKSPARSPSEVDINDVPTGGTAGDTGERERQRPRVPSQGLGQSWSTRLAKRRKSKYLALVFF